LSNEFIKLGTEHDDYADELYHHFFSIIMDRIEDIKDKLAEGHFEISEWIQSIFEGMSDIWSLLLQHHYRSRANTYDAIEKQTRSLFSMFSNVIRGLSYLEVKNLDGNSDIRIELEKIQYGLNKNFAAIEILDKKMDRVLQKLDRI
jgi:hypothetical protein